MIINDKGTATPTVERKPMISDFILAENLKARSLYLVELILSVILNSGYASGSSWIRTILGTGSISGPAREWKAGSGTASKSKVVFGARSAPRSFQGWSYYHDPKYFFVHHFSLAPDISVASFQDCIVQKKNRTTGTTKIKIIPFKNVSLKKKKTELLEQLKLRSFLSKMYR